MWIRSLSLARSIASLSCDESSAICRWCVTAVLEDDDRGRHTTTSRQMIFLPGGGIGIDTPGMRELQLWDSEEGLSRAFQDIGTLAENCKFRNRAHGGEPGCAVEAAILECRLVPERL